MPLLTSLRARARTHAGPAVHLTPCLVLLVDFFFFERPYAPPASTYGAFLLASACGIAYGLWAEWSVPPSPLVCACSQESAPR